jgi:hypothetical protein
MTKKDLIKYYDYLTKHKIEVFNSFYKLKNDRELKLSVLLDDKNIDILDSLRFEINKATNSIDKISIKIKILLKGNDLILIKKNLELYAEILEDSIKYIDYVEDEVKNLINS